MPCILSKKHIECLSGYLRRNRRFFAIATRWKLRVFTVLWNFVSQTWVSPVQMWAKHAAQNFQSMCTMLTRSHSSGPCARITRHSQARRRDTIHKHSPKIGSWRRTSDIWCSCSRIRAPWWQYPHLIQLISQWVAPLWDSSVALLHVVMGSCFITSVNEPQYSFHVMRPRKLSSEYIVDVEEWIIHALLLALQTYSGMTKEIWSREWLCCAQLSISSPTAPPEALAALCWYYLRIQLCFHFASVAAAGRWWCLLGSTPRRRSAATDTARLLWHELEITLCASLFFSDLESLVFLYFESDIRDLKVVKFGNRTNMCWSFNCVSGKQLSQPCW